MLLEIIGGILDFVFGENEKYQNVTSKMQEGLGKVENLAYQQQDKVTRAETLMSGKTDEQLKNVIKSSGGSYSSIEKQAAYNEYKSRKDS